MGITIENLQVDDLHANPNNPRKQVGDVDELASSIRSQGIKQPLLVTPTGETDIYGHKQYRVVIGHRRLAAPDSRDSRPCPRSSRRWTRAANARSCSWRTRNAPT
ncbi:MAG: ParB/RepB/Spo0J family partition protein [Bifidobacterium bifidum]